MPGPRAVCFRTMLILLKASPGGGWSTTCCSVERLATREDPVPFSDDVLSQSRQRLESELVEIEKELAELGAAADGSIQAPLQPNPGVLFADRDGGGVEAAPAAAAWGAEGANAMGHVDGAAGGLSLEHLGRLGIANVVEQPRTPPATMPLGAFGTMAE